MAGRAERADVGGVSSHARPVPGVDSVDPGVSHWLPSSSPDVEHVSTVLRDLGAARTSRVAASPPAGAASARPGRPLDRPDGTPATVPLGDVEQEASGRMTFTADGRFWWDGARWQQLEDAGPEARPGRSDRRRLLGAALVAVLLAGAGVVTHVTQRTQAFERDVRVALVDGRAAQEAFRVEHGRYAGTTDELASAGMPAVTRVSLEVLGADQDGYCLGAGGLGARTRWFATHESGMTGSPCP